MVIRLQRRYPLPRWRSKLVTCGQRGGCGAGWVEMENHVSHFQAFRSAIGICSICVALEEYTNTAQNRERPLGGRTWLSGQTL